MGEHAGPQDRLLGRLVEIGFGAGRVEVMATAAVAIMLEDDQVAKRFTAWLEECSGVDLSSRDLVYIPEEYAEGGRVDVAGRDGSGMRVALEAKFDAHLGAEQLSHYARSVQGSLLGVLVPAHRVEEAQGVLASVQDALDALEVTGIVFTWDQLAGALAESGADEGDVEQFRSLCRVAGGLDIAHFSDAELGPERERRLDDLHTICDRVTDKLHRQLSTGSLYGLQPDNQGFTGYRYVCPNRGYYCFAIGVRTWETGLESAIWMRWRSDTEGAVQIRQRLQEASVEIDSRGDDGHMWVPLQVPSQTDGTTIIGMLVEQAVRLDALARGIPMPDHPVGAPDP